MLYDLTCAAVTPLNIDAEVLKMGWASPELKVADGDTVSLSWSTGITGTVVHGDLVLLVHKMVGDSPEPFEVDRVRVMPRNPLDTFAAQCDYMWEMLFDLHAAVDDGFRHAGIIRVKTD